MGDMRRDEQTRDKAGEQASGQDPLRQQGGDEPASALGGGKATRSSTAEGPDPAEEQD